MHGVFRWDASSSLANLLGSLPPLAPLPASAYPAGPAQRAPLATPRAHTATPRSNWRPLSRSQKHIILLVYVTTLSAAETAILSDASDSPRAPPGTAQERPGIARGLPGTPRACQKSCQRAPRDVQGTRMRLRAHPEGCKTHMRIISTGLPVSFPLSLCSSLWGRGQHTDVRHTNRSSCQFPTFPLLKPWGKGANHPA